ncbi:hypothetical protein [Candidatus Pantoea multigeneris]|nr:hypothetical protein [Pantoea multigeneris]
MTEKRDNPSTQKPRRTVRRSDEFKAKLAEASSLLADKMEEKRHLWDSK